MNIENGNIRQTQFEKKISRSIGILHKLKKYFPFPLKTLYRSLILQHITYNKLMN